MADATSILETLWARIIERIGSKVSEAAQAASDANSDASKARVEGDRAKAEADRAAASAAQAAETASSGAPDATTSAKGKVMLAGVALFLAYTHRSNLARLRAGTESRFERVRLFARRRSAT